MNKINTRAKKSSKGISLPLNKDKFYQNSRLYDIIEATKVLEINEMAFRQFLAENIFDCSGMPKEKFLEKGYFWIYSKKLQLQNTNIFINKIKISQNGICFLGWLFYIKQAKK